MKPILVFRKIFRRRMILVGVIVLVLVASSVVVATNLFRGTKKIKAWVYCDYSTPKNCTFHGGGNSISANTIKYENANITLDNASITISGHHYFNNLTFKNGSSMTHNALTVSDINSDNTLKLSGQNKKVYLNITGTLRMEGTSVVDVSGKGFPAFPANQLRTPPFPLSSYGPGGGTNLSLGYSYAPYLTAGGGGYGGAGGEGSISPGHGPAGGPAYGSANAPTYHGSAGGSAYYSHFTTDIYSDGGAGGGVIDITAGNISLDESSGFSANGSDSTGCSATPTGDICQGAGGAGGSIYLNIINYSGQMFREYVEAGLSDISRGQTGSAYYQGASHGSGSVNLTAAGGSGGDHYLGKGTSGGGGRIAVVVLPRPNYKISKWLESVDQPNQPMPISPGGTVSANPYALQLGDAIKVKIKVDGIEKDARVDDAILQRPNFATGTIYCQPRVDSIKIDDVLVYSPGNNDYDSTARKVYWKKYDKSASSPTFSYICDMTKL